MYTTVQSVVNRCTLPGIRDLEDIREQIARHGTARKTAHDEARAVGAKHLAELAKLAPVALDAGMTKYEFAELARISRVTLDKLLAGR